MKVIEENKVDASCISCSSKKNIAWWKNRLFVMLLVYLVIFILGLQVNFAKPFLMSLLLYLQTIAWPVFIGLLLGGIIDWLVPREYVSNLLAGSKKRTIVYSVIAGFMMTACSHGIGVFTGKPLGKFAPDGFNVWFLWNKSLSNCFWGDNNCPDFGLYLNLSWGEGIN